MPELNVKDALSKKIGPFPGVVWAGLIGGSFLLVRVLKGQTGGGSSVTPIDTSTGSIPSGADPGSGSSGGTDDTSGGNAPDVIDYTSQFKAIQDALTQENTYLHNIQHTLRHPTTTTEPPPTTTPPPGGATLAALRARLADLLQKLLVNQRNLMLWTAKVTNLTHALNKPGLSAAQRHDLQVKLDRAQSNRHVFASRVENNQQNITTVRQKIASY